MQKWKSFLLVSLGLGFAIGFATAQNSPVPAPISTPALGFDAETKEYHAKPLELSAPFAFTLRNNWTNEIVIRSVHTSCGCTVASLPATTSALML